MIVYLEPRAPFTKAVPRSDTLFGAVCWAVRLLYGEARLTAVIDEFEQAISQHTPPPFLLSSLFPYFEDNNGKIIFLPRPLLPPAQITIESEVAYRAFKKLKKASYVSRTVFERLANGKLNETMLCRALMSGEDDYHLQSGALVTGAERDRIVMLPELMVTEESARNAINRLSISTGDEGGQLYYQPIVSARSRGATRSGFYLLVRVANGNAEIGTMLKAAFRFLAEKGLGGDISVGRGHCQVEFDDSEIVGADNGERLLSLSLLHPGAEDRAHLRRNVDCVYARLERRKGFIENSYINEAKQVWKPTLFMLAEGATFPRDGAREIYGTLFREEQTRSGADFQVRINGLAYTLAMKAEVSG